MATSLQISQKADLAAKLTAAQNAYNEELYQNNTGKSYAQSGTWIFPFNNQQTDQASFMNWLSASNASLATKLSIMNSAQANYDALIAEIARTEAEEAAAKELAFKQSNPEVYQNIQQAKITAAAEVEKTKAEVAVKEKLMSEDQLFAQKRAKTIMWVGIGTFVIIAGTILYFVFKKTKPEPNQA